MQLTPSTIQVRKSLTTNERVQVQAHITDDALFALHKGNADGTKWVVTHVPSGVQLAASEGQRAEAKATQALLAIRALACDWTFTEAGSPPFLQSAVALLPLLSRLRAQGVVL